MEITGNYHIMDMKTNCINNGDVSFGIAFRVYKNQSGMVSADLLDFKQELQMYKYLDERLKNDTFIKTQDGIKSDSLSMDKDGANQLRYTDDSGSYFIADNGTQLNGLSGAFKSIRKSFDNIMNKDAE